MFTKVPKIIFVLSVVLYLFHFLFFWLFESTDSLFYVTFADFIKTGKYFMPHPYYYTVPSTMEPPLYSVFLYLAQIFPRADVVIHLVQISAIVISSLLIFKIFEKYTRSEIALLIATAFLLTPSHSIYISNLVAEPIAILFITFYVYLVHKIVNEGKTHLLSFLLVLSSVMVLQRYNLIVFYGFTLCLIIIRLLRFRKMGSWKDFVFLNFSGNPSGIPFHSSSRFPFRSLKTKSNPTAQILLKNAKVLFFCIGFIISMGLLIGWVLMNHRFNGSWGLSNAEGKHLYNRIFHFDRLLPPADDASFVKFKSIVGENIDYFKPWWFYEPQLIAKVGSETEASKLMGEVALSALASNPIKYIIDMPGFFFFAHGDNPTYHDKLYLWSGSMSSGCRTAATISFCQPIINIGYSYQIWDVMVRFADSYYLSFAKYINYFLLFPALVWSFIKKDRFIKMIATLYLFSILFFVAVEAPIPRYTYIFTPLKTILIGYLGMTILPQAKRLSSLSSSRNFR